MSKSDAIVITGSTGFIGRRVAQLVKQSFPNEIVYYYSGPKKTIMEKSGLKVLKSLGISPVEIDLTKPLTLKKLPISPKLIIHLAANTDTYDKDHSVNSEGVVNLFKAVSPINRNTHIIHISTTAFMGGKRNFGKKLTEKSKCTPNNIYSRTKLKGERYIKQMCKKEGFRLTILRLPTVYGKNMRSKSLFDELNRMINKKSILSRLNWPGLTDLVHVDDVANTILFFTKAKPSPGKPEIYIVSGESVRLSNLYQLLYLKRKKRYNEIKLPAVFWKTAAKITELFPLLEGKLPDHIYNWLWRSTLIVDNVIWCDSSKLANKLKTQWKPKKFNDNIADVI